ncbi:MAG: bacteriocin fulvocin C-related protein [Vicinamibacterales bacterium]
MMVALAIPAETVLLKALSTPDQKAAAGAWAASLTATERTDAAAAIRTYSFAYRRALMGVLTKEQVSDVWRGYLLDYLAAHPDVDAEARSAVEAAVALATPEFFTSPTDAEREQVTLVAEQISQQLGPDVARDLLYRLGPEDGTFARAEPWMDRLALGVRSLFVVTARRADDCECNTDFGCDGQPCKAGFGCVPDTEWPACGWFWAADCDGMCAAPGTRP